MFNKYQSHSLTDLSRKLAELFTVKTTNPMKPAWVIVQNNEVKEWLSLQVAKENGISGNIKFIFPSEFIWMIYRLKDSDVPKTLPTDLNALHWTLFELLGRDKGLLAEFPFISDSEISITKRFQLAGQLADVFDQYQVYRPGMVFDWKQGKITTKHTDEQWQLKLWQKLTVYWAENPDAQNIPGRSDAHNNVIKWLDDGDTDIIKDIPKDIYVFGLSHLSKPFMDVMAGISCYRDIHFLCRTIKLITKNKELNALFESWQSPYNKQLKLLDELTSGSRSESETVELGNNLSNLPEIELHSCHGARREVEALKDEILRFLDEHPDYDPSDILILLPDADEYAPLLETHFNKSGDSKNLGLPLTKLYRNKTQLLEHSLVTILGLLNSSFKPSKVIDVLSLNPVKSRFDIQDSDIDQIEEWILSNRIYRGLGETFNDTFSWQKGINQLMAGAIMQPGYLESYKGLVPLVEISTSEEVSLVAKFSLFVHTLKNIAAEVSVDKTPEQWLNLMELICKELILDVDKENEEAAIFNKTSRLKEQVKYSSGVEPVSFSVFKNWFTNQIDITNSSSGRFGQGITVSTYIPYRSVPFKFIAILGLNEGVFPRRAIRPEFDLIYKDPQVGDRIQSEDDNYLFFEVLSSAIVRLHLSYKGQDLRNETDRLPSMLVQQLKECMPDKIKVIRHRLHPFSKFYFDDNAGLKPHKPARSYDQMQKDVAIKIGSFNKAVQDFRLSSLKNTGIFQTRDISLMELINFLYEPAKYILSNELNINFRVYQNDIQDRESFNLKGLDKYRVDTLLYESLQKGFSVQAIGDYVQTSGYLPDMWQGKRVFEEEYKKTVLLKQEINKLTDKDEVSHEIRIERHAHQVFGTIRGIHGRSLVLHRVGQRRAKHEIEQWVLHNALIANGFPLERSLYLSFDKSDTVEINTIETDAIDRNVFNDLLNWYISEKPLMDKVNFFPKTSKIFSESYLKDGDVEKAIRKAKQTFTPGRFNRYAEGGEESNLLIWRGEDPLKRPSFKHNSMNFWAPYLKAVEDSDG